VQRGPPAHADGPEKNRLIRGVSSRRVVGLSIDAISTVRFSHDTKSGLIIVEIQVLVCVDADVHVLNDLVILRTHKQFAAHMLSYSMPSSLPATGNNICRAARLGDGLGQHADVLKIRLWSMFAVRIFLKERVVCLACFFRGNRVDAALRDQADLVFTAFTKGGGDAGTRSVVGIDRTLETVVDDRFTNAPACLRPSCR